MFRSKRGPNPTQQEVTKAEATELRPLYERRGYKVESVGMPDGKVLLLVTPPRRRG